MSRRHASCWIESVILFLSSVLPLSQGYHVEASFSGPIDWSNPVWIPSNSFAFCTTCFLDTCQCVPQTQSLSWTSNDRRPLFLYPCIMLIVILSRYIIQPPTQRFSLTSLQIIEHSWLAKAFLSAQPRSWNLIMHPITRTTKIRTAVDVPPNHQRKH